MLPADVGEREQVETAIESFIDAEGAIDVLVANAGVAWYGPVRKMPVEEAERMTRVNWLGTVYTVTAALPAMLDRAEGSIVIVSSAAGHRSFPWAAVYGATKFAQRGFLEALRHELSGTGLTVTGVYPGEVETHLHDDDHAAGAHARLVRRRLGDPARVRRRAGWPTAIEGDEASVFVPWATRILGVAHGASPAPRRQVAAPDPGRRGRAVARMSGARPILVAPDKFRGTLAASEVATAIGRGLVEGGVESVELTPIADGGEGSMEMLVGARGGTTLPAEVHDPLGRRVTAAFGLLDGGRPRSSRWRRRRGSGASPRASAIALGATSRGTGELIGAAIEAGARTVIVAIGGSATTDGGRGALEALGASFTAEKANLQGAEEDSRQDEAAARLRRAQSALRPRRRGGDVRAAEGGEPR